MDTNTIAIIQALSAKQAPDPLAAYWPVLILALATLVGHVSTYFQNRTAQIAAKEAKEAAAETAKVVDTIKTDVNSKSTAADSQIKSQQEQLREQASKIALLEERLNSKPVAQPVVVPNGFTEAQKAQIAEIVNSKLKTV